jgi:hypothetical protein
MTQLRMRAAFPERPAGSAELRTHDLNGRYRRTFGGYEHVVSASQGHTVFAGDGGAWTATYASRGRRLPPCTRHQQGFTGICPSRPFPSPVIPGRNGDPWALPRASHPAEQDPAAHAGGGDGPQALARSHAIAISDLLRRNSLTACDLMSQRTCEVLPPLRNVAASATRTGAGSVSRADDRESSTVETPGRPRRPDGGNSGCPLTPGAHVRPKPVTQRNAVERDAVGPALFPA